MLYTKDTLQEEEQRLKPGTRKEVAFKILKGAGSEGRTVLQIVAEAKQQGLREFADSERKQLQMVRFPMPAPPPPLLPSPKLG